MRTDGFRFQTSAIGNFLFALLFVGLGDAGFAGSVFAQPAKLAVSYTGVGPVNLPVVLAKETGIFARNGLDVTVLRAQAAVSTMACSPAKSASFRQRRRPY